MTRLEVDAPAYPAKLTSLTLHIVYDYPVFQPPDS